MGHPMKKIETVKVGNASHEVTVRTLTPMDMVSRAVESGASMEILERLMALQERWEKNQARKAFDDAISKAKAELPVILKDKVVEFSSQSGKKTNYQYEDFATIYNAVTPVLSKNGIDARFRTTSDKDSMTVTCMLTGHGYREENSLTAPNDLSGNKNAIQAIGSTQTYLQRYTLKAALGLAASKDDDAVAASNNGTIMQDQVDALETMIKDVGGDRAGELRKNTLAYFGITEFSELPTSEYVRCATAIEKKRAKK